VLSGGGVKRLRKTPGAITARSAAHASMVISATVNTVSGQLADPLPTPQPNSSASQLITATMRLAARTRINHS